MIEDGLHVYIGTTGTGKTHKAIRDAIELARAKSQGVLVVDSRGAQNLKDIPEYRADRKLFEDVYSYGKVCRIVPKDEAEFDKLMRAADTVGKCVIVIDEVSSWARNATLLNLCRVWRHRQVSLFITTQKVGADIEQTILACDPRLYIFRLTAPRSLEWAEKWHKLTPEQLKNLKVGEFYKLSF